MEICNEHKYFSKSEINKIKNLNLKKSIKSSFILKKIFSFINEKKKLKIVIYNKEYKKSLDIDISNYKISSGKIKIKGINGYGKEINLESMEIVFKGEYLNGKRHGKGKEYIIFPSFFEGEYLNGERNGQGKEYEYGKLIFEGEYLNGKRNGKGKEYHWNGNLIFEGEYLNGKRNGKGKEYNGSDHLIFEGEYLNGMRNKRILW